MAIFKTPGQIRIGTSGWIYRHRRGVFYPPDLPVGHWFAFYAKHFDTVEINNTFYRLPDVETFVDWRRQAPAGFVYAVKASRFLTHMKKLNDPEEPLARILGGARKLGRHLGPVLYQLPPHWGCNLERLRQFIALLPSALTHVFEFRDTSWFNEDVRALLTQAGIGFCIHDLRGFRCPAWVTGRAVYIRFHGSTGVAYAGRYGLPHLRRWAGQIREFRGAGHHVYVYFNNDDRGYAVENARRLRGLLEERPAVQLGPKGTAVAKES